MVRFYHDMVVFKGKKWNTVPKLWLEGVCEKLIEEGYTLNDDGTVSKAEA